MRKNTEAQTLYRNYVWKWKFLIQEYELVKQKRHAKFRTIQMPSHISPRRAGGIPPGLRHS